MSEIVGLTDREEMIGSMTTDIVDQKELAEQLLEQAKEQNIELVGPDGLLGQLTKSVLEMALDAEMSEHLGYEKHDPPRRSTLICDHFKQKPLRGPVESSQYPAISKLWENAWSEFVPFLDYDVEIRRVICSTNAIESLNARYRRAVRARGHFPNDTTALKCLYLATRALGPTGRGRARWATRWKPALNAFTIAFAGRIN